MTLTDLLAPTYAQMLGSLSGWLAKAQAQRGEEGAQALLAARLAPDMYPLATQICFACVQAYEGLCRLRGETFPEAVETLLDAGRNAAEHPGTLEQAQARIAAARGFVEAAAADTLDVDADEPLEHALPQGLVFDFTAGQYARDWTLPQFYFHVMTAYAILRAEGIALGKADYVAHLLPHVRGAAAPSGVTAAEPA